MKAGIYSSEKLIVVDNHSLSLFRECPRKYFHRIIEGLIWNPFPFGNITNIDELPTDAALLYGIAFHKALDTYYLTESVSKAQNAFTTSFQPVPDDKKRTPERGRNMVKAYHNKWKNTPLNNSDSVICERCFLHPMGEVKVGFSTWKVVYGGIVDKTFITNNKTTLSDHKTTSMAIQSLFTTYEQSNQFLGYIWGARNHWDLDVWDLVVDVVVLNPKNDNFYRPKVATSMEGLEEWKESIFHTIRQIIDCVTSNTFPQWGDTACRSWSKVCSFFDICNSSSDMREMVKETQFLENRWKIEER